MSLSRRQWRKIISIPNFLSPIKPNLSIDLSIRIDEQNRKTGKIRNSSSTSEKAVCSITFIRRIISIPLQTFFHRSLNTNRWTNRKEGDEEGEENSCPSSWVLIRRKKARFREICPKFKSLLWIITRNYTPAITFVKTRNNFVPKLFASFHDNNPHK